MHTGVVGAASEHEAPVFPDGSQQIGDMGLGHVIYADIPDSEGRYLTGYLVGELLGVAVHRGVGNHEAVLSLILAPLVVECQHLARILAPYKAV